MGATTDFMSSKLALSMHLYLVITVGVSKRLRPQFLNESKGGWWDSPEYFIRLASLSFKGKDPGSNEVSY